MKTQNKQPQKTDTLASQTPEAFAALIAASYEARSKEITSLRLYDRGERAIHAPDLRTIMQSV